jgi:hypothetical protein
MSNMGFKVYEILKSKFSADESASIVNFFENKSIEKHESLKDVFATKEDLMKVESLLKTEISNVETSLKREMAQVETFLKQEIYQVETSMKQEIAHVETSLKKDFFSFENKITRQLYWINIVQLFAIVTSVFALIKFVVK